MQLTSWKRTGRETFVPCAVSIPHTTFTQIERLPFARRVFELPNAQDFEGVRAVDAVLLVGDDGDVRAFGFALLKDPYVTPKRYLLRAITLRAANDLAELAVALNEFTLTIEQQAFPACREVLQAWWKVAHPMLLTTFLCEDGA